jgi:hypothetical protein
MIDLFQQFKNAKIKNITIAYNKAVQILIIQYNYYVSIIKKNNRLKKKATSIANIYNQLNTNLNLLKQQYISNINKINSMIMPPNIIPGKNLAALTIGINYVGSSNELAGCINDVNNINNLLKQNGFNKITTLTDYTNIKPTKNNILSQFTTLLTNANKGDTIFFFYSGHGSNTRDTNGDEVNNVDELLCPVDYNMIVDDELKNIIQTKLKSGVTLIALFDSCFSGSVLDLRYQYMDSLQNNELTENPNEEETTGQVIMISGCSDIETSADAYINNTNCGAMTWSFLQTLQQNKNITWRELALNMRDFLKKSNFTQTPQLTSGYFLNIDTKVFI